MVSGDFGAFGFWIFVAAIIVVSTWAKSRREAEKHETLRRIVEKTGVIDEAKLKELFSDPPSDDSKPGYGYRALRVGGSVVLFVAAGLGTFFLLGAWLGKMFGHVIEWWYGGVAISVGLAIVGAGLFFASRFAELPSDNRGEPRAR
jgi:hypothetical protein